MYRMPYLDKPQVYYENINEQKYNDIKAEILRRYVQTLESKTYPHNSVYPTRR